MSTFVATESFTADSGASRYEAGESYELAEEVARRYQRNGLGYVEDRVTPAVEPEPAEAGEEGSGEVEAKSGGILGGFSRR